MTIIFDSGIRTGPDVFKAIALGAHVVMVGRLYVWGMSHEAEAGCRHVIKSLLAVSSALAVYGRQPLIPCFAGPGHNHDRRGVPQHSRGRLPQQGRPAVQPARSPAGDG